MGLCRVLWHTAKQQSPVVIRQIVLVIEEYINCFCWLCLHLIISSRLELPWKTKLWSLLLRSCGTGFITRQWNNHKRHMACVVSATERVFSVRSMYRAITTTNIIQHNHTIWKLKLPLKIKIFMWYLIKGVTLTKDNLARRRWKGSLKCCCCNLNETIQHLFSIAKMLNFCGDS